MLMCRVYNQIFLYMYVCIYNIDTHCIFIKPQLMEEKDQVTREKEQLQQELQTVNTRADEQIQQLRQQVSDIIVTSSYKYQ